MRRCDWLACEEGLLLKQVLLVGEMNGGDVFLKLCQSG